MPFNDAVAGPEPKEVVTDKTMLKMEAVMTISSLYFTALANCPDPARTPDDCLTCLRPEREECDRWSKALDMLDEGKDK